MIYPGRHKQLFLDDDAIETKYGLRRTVNKPDRVGPVIGPDRSRAEQETTGRNSPQWNSDKGLWEWYYWTGFEVDPSDDRRLPTQRLSTYATSEDGVRWERPSLGLYEHRGAKDNNIAWDPDGDRHSHVIRDERDPDPSRRYKAFFGSSGRRPAVSPDGFEWTMIDVPPIPSDDTSYLTYDEITEQFVATVKLQTEWGRSVWLSTSNDFIDWTEPELIFHSDEIDRNNRRRRIRQVVEDPAYLTPHVVEQENFIAQVYMMAVMPYEGLYLAFPVLFNPSGVWLERNHTGISQVELAVSRDLYNWKRVANRDLFLPVQPWDGETYDTAQLSLSGPPIVREDLGEIWVYYNASRFRAQKHDFDESYARYFDDMGALSLAKVRLDGFVSLDAEKEGSLVTTPFGLHRGNLYVNVESQRGELRAAVLDAETMEPLPGLSLADCDPVRGDELRGKLTWQGRSAPGREKPVRLRFALSQAKLYAFWLGE